MGPSPDTLIDGRFYEAESIGPARLVYPFRQNGDRISAYFSQDYWQRLPNYTPQELSTPFAQSSDFYLLSETPLTGGIADLFGFSRVYSRIPTPQTVNATMALTKPTPGVVVGYSDYTFFYQQSSTVDVATTSNAFEVRYAGSVFEPNNKVYSVISCPQPSFTVASGGTFTLTYKTSTTAALAYSAADATIAAAVNALPSVIADGFTVTVANALGTAATGYIILTIATGATTTAFSITSSLTPTGASSVYWLRTNATTQYGQIGVRLSIPNHGLVAADELYIRQTTSSRAYALNSGYWGVIDANTISFPRLYISDYTTVTAVGRKIRAFTPGTGTVQTQAVQSFYLPGVTAGITTIADIPLVTPQASDLGILTLAASSSTGFQNYQVSELTQWIGSPIYTRTVTKINTDNF